MVFNREATVEQTVLDLVQFHLANQMSPSIKNRMRMNEEYDAITDSFIRQLSFFLLSNKVHEEENEAIVRRYPATIWEELKRDFWPKWLKRKFPVRYSKDVTLHNHKHYHICPHLDIPDKETHIRFMILNDIGSKLKSNPPQ